MNNNNNDNNTSNNNNNNSNLISSPPLSPILSPPLSPTSLSSLSATFSSFSPLSSNNVGVVEVILLEGKNLVSKNKSADVYVRMKVGDGFFRWNKTNTVKKARAHWNFVCAMKVRPKQSRVLHLRVNEVNFFSPDDTLGECHVDLESLQAHEAHELSLPLLPANSASVHSLSPSLSSFPSSSSPSLSSPSISTSSSLSPTSARNIVVNNRGELRFVVSYHPNGKPVPSRDSKVALPIQLLDSIKTPENNNPLIPLPSTNTPNNCTNTNSATPNMPINTTTTTTTAATPQNSDNNNNNDNNKISSSPESPTSITLSKMIGPFIASEPSSQPKSAEQVQAEQLYNKAMEEMSKFVEYARTAKKNKTNNNTTVEATEIENTLAPAALRMASQLLFESLKLHRSGKSFAMLAFIFFQFDSLELTSKYLGYATQLEPTFPVIARLRKLLVESGCEREPLDSKVQTDRLSVVVVSAKKLPPTSPSVFCRLLAGYQEIPKDTTIASFSDHHPHQPPEPGTVHWEIFFEVPLTKATERYHYGHQNLILQVFEKRDDTVTMLGESAALNMFTLERDRVFDFTIPLTNGKGEVRLVLNYQMAYLSPEDMLPLLYSALLSKDQAMVTSILKRNPNLDLTFRDTNSHSTPSELEPKYSTLLTKAARHGNVRMIKDILELGASINATDVDGFTAIMRAVQFEGVHDTVRAVRYLNDLGADLIIKNKRSFDIFAYCQSVEMRLFLKERSPMVLYKFAVVICPNCRYVQFPACTESEKKTLQGRGCVCTLEPCPHCSFVLSEEHRQEWMASQRELYYAGQAFTATLPPVIDHYLFQCPACLTFGFPGTFTPAGSQLTTGTDVAVVGTSDNSYEKVEFPLKEAETMWTLLTHGSGCSLHTASYRLVRVLLSRVQLNDLISLSPNSFSFFDTPKPQLATIPVEDPAPFTLDQLPIEILQHIVGYLTSSDIVSIERVSKKVRETCDDEGFWKCLVVRDFRIRFQTKKIQSGDDGDTWKHTYLFYTKLYSWVRELLFEENFFPRCTNTITEDGQVEVRFRLNGKKYLFNLDGTPFTFEEEFMLVLYFSAPGEITALKLIAQNQTATNALQLCSVLSLPTSTNEGDDKPVLTSDIIRHQLQGGTVTLTLAMEVTAIKRWVAPYLAMNIPGFYAFLMLKDNVAGSVILDIFYYSLRNIVLENIS